MTGSEYEAQKRREKRSEWNRRYYQKHRDEILSKRKRYADANRDRLREYHRQYQAEYRAGILRRGEETEEK